VDTLRLQGLTADEEDILRATDRTLKKDSESEFINLSLQKTGRPSSEQIRSLEQIDRMRQAAKATAAKIAGDMKQGRVTPAPLITGHNPPCAWCPYTAFCGLLPQKPMRRAMSSSQAQKIIDGEDPS